MPCGKSLISWQLLGGVCGGAWKRWEGEVRMVGALSVGVLVQCSP